MDGSLLARIPKEQGGGITFTERNGISSHFATLDDLPIQVRDKLTHLSHAERQLQVQSVQCVQDNGTCHDVNHYMMAMDCDTNRNVKGTAMSNVGIISSGPLRPMRYFR